MSGEAPRVAQLFSYPLKSGRGREHDAAELTRTGLSGDRQYMLVDAAGHFVTQRGYPRLALVELAPAAAGRGATLRIPGRTAIEFELPSRSQRRDVLIWGQWVPAEATDARADQALSAYLGAPVRLVRFPDDGERMADPPYAAPEDRVAYADGFPLLVIGTASLDALNAKLAASGKAPVPMRRFRPNLVVQTDVPFIEDRWRRIQVGDVPLELVKRCARCVILDVDPATGESRPGVLETLASFRKEGKRVLFGQNAIHRAAGWVRVGDPVAVLAEGEPC